MLFRQLFDYNTWTYTYLIADLKTKEAVLVDPVLEQVERNSKLVQELELRLRYCLETHTHADHVTGTGKLRSLTDCQGVVPENASAKCADRFIKHGEVIKVGDNFVY
jgi:sulfur dioxygenase